MKRLLFILPIILLAYSVEAQRAWRSYEWANYKIEFELPEEYEIITNTSSELEAKGEGLRFVVYPYDDKVKHEGGLKGFVNEMIENDLKLQEIDDLELMEVDGFEAGYLTGTKGNLNYLVFGLKDLDNGNKFYGYVAFEDEQEQIVEDAMEVFQSFGKI